MESKESGRRLKEISSKLRNLIEQSKGSRNHESSTKTTKKKEKKTFIFGNLKRSRISEKSQSKKTPVKPHPRPKGGSIIDMNPTRDKKIFWNGSFLNNPRVKTPISNMKRKKGRSFAYPARSGNKENLIRGNESIVEPSPILSQLKCSETILERSRNYSNSNKKSKNSKSFLTANSPPMLQMLSSNPGSSFVPSFTSRFGSPYSLKLTRIDSANKGVSLIESPPFATADRFYPIPPTQKKQEINIYKGNYFEGVLKSEITQSMRAILVNWMGEVADHFFMKRKTIHYGVCYLDRYLAITKLNVHRNEFQLLGIVCIYVAAKFEELEVCPIDDFLALAKNIYTKEMLFKLESTLLTKIKFRIWTETLEDHISEVTSAWDSFIERKCTFLTPEEKKDIYYHLPYRESYKAYCRIMQLGDGMLLDPEYLCFDKRLLALSLLYIVTGYLLKEFTFEEIVEYFPCSSQYLMDLSIEYNLIFREFLSFYYEYTIDELIPTVQYASSWFSLEIDFDSPSVIQKDADRAAESSYEEMLCFYKLNESALHSYRTKVLKNN